MKNRIEKIIIKLKKCDKIIIYKQMYFLLSDEYQLNVCDDKFVMDDIVGMYHRIIMGISDYGIQLGSGIRKFKRVEVLKQSEITEIIRDFTISKLGIS
jgi:hypothetical protein